MRQAVMARVRTLFKGRYYCLGALNACGYNSRADTIQWQIQFKGMIFKEIQYYRAIQLHVDNASVHYMYM